MISIAKMAFRAPNSTCSPVGRAAPESGAAMPTRISELANDAHIENESKTGPKRESFKSIYSLKHALGDYAKTMNFDPCAFDFHLQRFSLLAQ